MKNIVYLLIVLLTFYSCSENSNSLENDNLSENDIVLYQKDNIKIILLDVKDSRCPLGLSCFWAGNAEVSLKMINNNESEDFILNTAGFINASQDFPKSKIILNHTIELQELLPLPEIEKTYSVEDYSVKLSVLPN